jgi:hypothetical protein
MKFHHSHWTIVWIFHVKPAKRRVFQRVYGPDGDWAQLFARDRNYLGTEFLRHSTNTRCYLTIDRWTSRAAYRNFKKKHRKEFVALDARCEALTVREIKIGEFSSTTGRTQNTQMRKIRSPSGFAGPHTR